MRTTPHPGLTGFQFLKKSKREPWRRFTPALLILAIPIVALFSLAVGELWISPAMSIAALIGQGDAADAYIITQLRLPRVITGFAVGFALAVSGAITQSIGRNLLATPDLLGVSAGSGAGAVIAIVVGSPEVTGVQISLAAFVGGLIAATLIFVFTPSKSLATNPALMLVMGFAVSAFFMAITSWLLIVGDLADAQRATSWLSGSLSGARWSSTLPLLLVLLLGAPALPFMTRYLAILRLGSLSASCLGIRVTRSTVALLFLAILWVSCATAAAGPISFISFAAPLFARQLLGPGPTPLWAVGALGALLLLIADLIARVVLSGAVPVGVVTAALGGGLLLVLVLRSSVEG